MEELLRSIQAINETNYIGVKTNFPPISDLEFVTQFYKDTIDKFEECELNAEHFFDDIHNGVHLLETVISDVKSASMAILSLAEQLESNAVEISSMINEMSLNANDENKVKFIAQKVLPKVMTGQSDSFDIISTLEFHDISKQKIEQVKRKLNTLNSKVNDMILALDINESDYGHISESHEDASNALNEVTPDVLDSQSLIDQLLSEFGRQ